MNAIQCQSHPWPQSRAISRSREGIILLVVLAMLGLFSLLAVSYVVFTSRARGAAAKIGGRERRTVDPTPLLELAEKQLIRDVTGPESSLFGHSLLGDLYGTRDRVTGRIRDARFIRPIPGVTVTANEQQFPITNGQMFSYLDGQFLRVPTNLADNGAVSPDLFNGRLCTFADGPLKDITFEIVRSFGDFDDRSAPPSGQNPVTNGMTGALLLDLTPQLMRNVTHTVNTGVTKTQTLEEWIRSGEIGTLFYEQGADGAWGIAGNDDNGNSTRDESNEAGAPSSDDVGYAFAINGQRLNGFGMGVNAAGTAMDLQEDSASLGSGAASHNFPVALQGNFSVYRNSIIGLPGGDTDEPYDAPDWQNMFLGYFPVDPELGAPTPSFLRPALINYILNEFQADLPNLSTNQLRAVIRLIQRCTMRPLPIQNDPIAGPNVAEGVRRFRYDRFTGSSANPNLTTELDYTLVDNPANRVTLGTQVLSLARGLIQGPWDVDNDGDGQTDSVWMDAGLPVLTMPDGTVVKPMVAMRIEDLGGRIDVNSAGSVAHFTNKSASTTVIGGLARGAYGTATSAPVPNKFALSSYAASAYRGLGAGPADMGLQSMFWTSVNESGFTRDVGMELLRLRFGKAYEERGPGRTIDPVSSVFMGAATGNDIMGLVRDPKRPLIHYPMANRLYTAGALGNRAAPLDSWGRSMTVLDVYGQPLVAHVSGALTDTDNVSGSSIASSFDEANNDAGEMNHVSSTNPDAGFSVDELEAVLRHADWGAGVLPDRLKNLIATEMAIERQVFPNPPRLDASMSDARLPAMGGPVTNMDGLHQPSEPGGNNYFDLTRQITTVSSSFATPSGVLPADMRGNAPNGLLYTQELANPYRFVPVRMFQRVFNPRSAPPGFDPRQWQFLTYTSVVAPEIRLGRKINLNRPLANEVDDTEDTNNNNTLDPGEDLNGNGILDRANGVADDSTESSANHQPTLFTNGTSFGQRGHQADYTPETNVMGPPALGFQGNDSRQLYARHLYCTMMFLLKNQSSGAAQEPTFVMPLVDGPNEAGLTPAQLAVLNAKKQAVTARRIAQWAVNAVDFRDPDSIMTPFEYDPNPFDGWDVDGDIRLGHNLDGTSLTVQQNVVWGMEAPALLLTESLAFHDRRVADTDKEGAAGSGKKRLPPGTEWMDNAGDDDVDQIRIPQGSLFLELFCPRTPSMHTPTGWPTWGATGWTAPEPQNYPRLNDQDAFANPLGASSDLYSYNNLSGAPITNGAPQQGRLVLDLNKVAPGGNPVWRIGISRAHNQDNPVATAKESSPLNLLTGQNSVNRDRDVLTLQPNQLDITTPADPAFRFDRVVWLAAQDPNNVATLPADTVRESIYYNRTPTTGIQGGQYAVIGPRALTTIGSKDDPSALREFSRPADPTPKNQHMSEQLIQLNANQVSVFNHNSVTRTPTYDVQGSPVAGAEIQPIVGMIAAAKPPTTATWPTYGTATPANPNETQIGLNISEPIPGANYYREPTYRLNGSFGSTTAAAYPIDAYVDLDPMNPQGSAIDEPLDNRPTAPLSQDFNGDGQKTGTRENYKTAYLQRLADPTRAYDALLNPYITVDWIPLDLTVFNGEEKNENKDDGTGAMQWIDPFDQDPFNSAPNEQFASRYKTGMIYQREMTPGNPLPDPIVRLGNLLSPHTMPLPNTSRSGVTDVVFDVSLHHDVDINNATAADPTKHSTTLGYLNHSFGMRWRQSVPASLEVQPYVGAPDSVKFPWLVWHDRPFASPHELMLVPFGSAGTIGMECSTPKMLGELYPGGTKFPGTGTPYVSTDARNYRSDYEHLFNYFAQNSDFTKSANFHRILDWVETSDTFDDSYKLLMTERFPVLSPGSSTPPVSPPTFMYGMPWPPTNETQWNIMMPLEVFRTPFNQIPSSVRRGQVNLNTMNGKRVYRELMLGYSEPAEITNAPTSMAEGSGAFYDDFVISRRGYHLADFNQSPNFPYRLDGRFDPDIPTDVAGTFVPGAIADMAPQLRSSRSPGYNPTPGWPDNTEYNQNVLRRDPVSANILRKTPPVRSFLASTGTAKPSDRNQLLPLFQREGNGGAHLDRDGSAFHRYQGINRLPNLTTGQSNAFAVWTTMGLFKLDVDTLSVGEEYGFEEGTNRRYRSFMIIDRSIPVRFEPGVDHNSSDVILLRRSLN